ncbi:hypothetical protein ON010_g5326 [Phytophthora cinnamomi]|nr:hypothetical protein ON010_g5326 [Phytophthora cinnamomi]
MLIRMMYWSKLSQTPWTKYVPRWHFKTAETQLESLDRAPARWPALKKVRLDDTAEITEALCSDVGGDEDDEIRDETFQTHKHSSGQARTPEPGAFPSPLARKEYSDLTAGELRIVEVPARGILSWRHCGILLKFQAGTAKAVCQTAEFPDYTPNLSKNTDRDAVRARWKPEEVKKLGLDTPWDDRFENRLKHLILHVSSPPGSVQQMYLDKIVTFMSNNRRAFWRIGHWFVIHHQQDAYSLGLHSERKNECDKACRLYQALLDEAVNAGLPQSVLGEPGVWTFPSKCCTWIWMADSHTKSDGTPFTLQEQFKLVDQEDPARAQWNTCASDDDRIAHLPAHVRSLKHRSAADCRRYLVSSKFP